MSFERERSARPDPARRRHFQTPEQLESRQLLSSGLTGYFSLYTPSDLYVTNPITHQRESISYRDLMQHNNPNSALLSNQGKIVSGTDRAGDVWTITVHGPGQVIVTDTTPNDGSLDDDIATIQIVNSSLTSTYVTGTVVASNRVLSSGTVLFNRLIATSGVRSIVLNGFNLSADVTPSVNQTPGIFLYGGVQTLRFNDILGLINTPTPSTPPQAYQIQIGDASTPIRVKPSIYLDSVYNSVFNGSVTPTSASTIPQGPLTSPSVIFSVNGVVQNFSVVSITQSPVPPNYIRSTQQGTTENWTGWPQSGPVPAGYQFFYNIVGTTGRTTLQASAVNHLNVVGKATNFTAQRGTQPFQKNLGGLSYLKSAKFGANADAVALDVKGRIGKVTFKRGLGDPAYVFNAKKQVTNQSSSVPATNVLLPATEYGVPLGSEGYPAHGLLGGVISAKSINALKVGPADFTTQTAQNPKFVQTGRTGYATTYLANPGTAVTNAAITTTGSIGRVKITGNQLNTEIKTGFDYQSYLAGLEGTRSASRIARIQQRGDLVSSVDSASFRPTRDATTGNSTYSFSTGTAGRGAITGTITGAVGHSRAAATFSKTAFPGAAISTGGRTALGNFGAGFFARRKSANLPPPK